MRVSRVQGFGSRIWGPCTGVMYPQGLSPGFGALSHGISPLKGIPGTPNPRGLGV